MAAAAFCPAASVWGPRSCSPLGGTAQSRHRPPSPKAGHVGFCQKTDFVPEKSSWIFSWHWRPSWRQELVRTQAGVQQGCGAPSQRARCGGQRGVARRRGVCNRVSREAREGRAGAEAARRPRADPCPRAHTTCPSALWLCQKHLEGTMPQRAVRTRTLLSVPPLLQPLGSPGRRVIAGPGSSGTWRAPGPMPRLGQCGGLSDSRHAGVCGHRLARGAEGEGCSGAACRRGAAPAPRRGRSQSSEHQHGLAAQDAQAAACQARVWRRMRCHRGCRRWPRSGTPCAQGLGSLSRQQQHRVGSGPVLPSGGTRMAESEITSKKNHLEGGLQLSVQWPLWRWRSGLH